MVWKQLESLAQGTQTNMKGNFMAIVSYTEDELDAMRKADPNWEAKLDALAAMSDDDIVYTDDAPKLTEEQLAGFRPHSEVMAERRERQKQTTIL
jgi:hypothetical protein